MKNPLTINIACACDQGFLPNTAAMLRSVLTNNRNHNLNIFLIYNDIPRKDINRLEKMILRSHNHFYPLRFTNLRRNEFPISNHVTIETYFRILIPDLVPATINKILYLDGDLIVRKDLADLWNSPLDTYPLAAVPNQNSVSQNNRLGLKPGNYYFNTGVMLLNLNWWRKNQLTQKVLEFITTHPEKLKWWDQDAINAIVDGNFVKLPRQWNVVSQFYFDETLKQDHLTTIQDPSIVHFSGMGNKPWEIRSSHPYKKEYGRYQNKTPWKTSIFNSHLRFLYLFAKKLKKQIFSLICF